MGSAVSSTAANHHPNDEKNNNDVKVSIVALPTEDEDNGESLHDEDDPLQHQYTITTTSTTSPPSNISSIDQNRRQSSFNTTSSLHSGGLVMRCPSSPARLKAIPTPPQVQSATLTPLAPDSPIAHQHHHQLRSIPGATATTPGTTPLSLQAIRTTSSTSSSRQSNVGRTYSNNTKPSKQSKRLAQGEFKSIISEEDRKRAERIGNRQKSTSWGASETVFRTSSNRTNNKHGGNSSMESGGGDISPLVVGSLAPPLTTDSAGMDSISKQPFQLLPLPLPILPPTTVSDQLHQVVMKTHSHHLPAITTLGEGDHQSGENTSSRLKEDSSVARSHSPPFSIRTKPQDSMPGGAATSSTIAGELSWMHPTFIEHGDDSSGSCRMMTAGGGVGGGGGLEESKGNNNNDSEKVILGRATPPCHSPLIPTPPSTASPKNNNNHGFHPLPLSPPTSPLINSNSNNSVVSGGGISGKIPSIRRRVAK